MSDNSLDKQVKHCGGGRDLVSNRQTAVMLWGLPTCAVLIGFLFSHPWAEIIWAVAYAVMGMGCVANARGCQRVHCHFTAPWFLLIALVAVFCSLQPAAAVALYAAVVAVAGLVGAAGIWLVTEKLWGRYWRSAGRG